MNIHLNILSTIDSEDYQNKKYTFNNNIYNVIKYNKENLKKYENEDYDKFLELAKYRSVIVRDNRVMSYSPGKSISYNKFKQDNDTGSVVLEDFIDGTMINVFYDNINNCWEIATKSTVGGNIVFFNDVKNYNYFENTDFKVKFENTTFRSMFFEACSSNNLNLDSLNKNFSYSFVMQHPFNRIVTPVVTPMLFLVAIYSIDNSNFPNVDINSIDINTFSGTAPYPFLNTNIKVPNKYNLDSYDNLENYYFTKQSPYACVGTMMYNVNGYRSKIRNPSYEDVRKLRGNQPKLQFNYLMLKKENKVKEFLYYYPECVVLFNKFKLLIYNYTNELFLNYISCFIRKEKPLKEYDFQYKVHMYNIHQKYVTELREQNKMVDKKVVIDYVNSLHPAQQMFVINYRYNKQEDKMEILCDNSI